MPTNTLKTKLEKEAKQLGFDEIGITTPNAIPRAASRLKQFLDAGLHGDMEWMQNNQDRRANPSVLWPEAKSIIMLTMNYGPSDDPLKKLDQKSEANFSVYALGKDYHDIIKKRLKRLARWLVEQTGEDVKVFVDTAPVMEKPLAEAAGLGWQGKHTNLVSKSAGSWTFLGSIFTTAEIAADDAETDHCGSCKKCLDICPTKAFVAPYQLDARRCISYLTIEFKGHIAREFREPMGNRIYGCDDCLAICPWNKWASQTKEPAFHPRENIKHTSFREYLNLDDAAFREKFSGSPVKRIGRDRFIRNVLIAAGNSKDKSLLRTVKEQLTDDAPIVRAMAIWAVSKLATADEFSKLKQNHIASENDPIVRMEWQEGQGTKRGTV